VKVKKTFEDMHAGRQTDGNTQTDTVITILHFHASDEIKQSQTSDFSPDLVLPP